MYIFSSANNVKEPSRKGRSIDRVKNYFTLQGGKYFREDIPNGRDEFTEDILSPEGYSQWIAIIGTVSKDTGDKYVGAASIKCAKTGPDFGPEMELALANSGWGVNPLNPDSEDVNQLYWLWKHKASGWIGTLTPLTSIVLL